MIVSEIRDLVQYINSTTKAKCVFGVRDSSPAEYPLIQVRMNQDFFIKVDNTKTMVTDIPLEIRIIVAKENEYKALEVLERLYLKIDQFNPHNGHTLEDTGLPEYVEETKTFEIGVLYKLKLMIHDT